MDVAALQAQSSATFGARDRAVLALELSDLVAWAISVAALEGVDLDGALVRYVRGCPRCGDSPCRCPADY